MQLPGMGTSAGGSGHDYCFFWFHLYIHNVIFLGLYFDCGLTEVKCLYNEDLADHMPYKHISLFFFFKPNNAERWL